MLQGLEINCPPYLEDLPANIGQLSKLRTLKATDCLFTALPTSFGELSLLETLELHDVNESAGSKLWTIEGLAPLKQLTQLKYLNLTGAIVRQPSFSDLLASCNFPVLEDLALFGGFPSSISNFTSLTSLLIEQDVVSEVPEGIGSLHLLERLWLLDNAVSLPSSFSKLTSLEVLQVATDMQSFAQVEHFTKLTDLNFHDDSVDQIPYPEFLWTFSSLKILDLWGSVGPSLPDALGNLINLESLYLRWHDEVEEFPETIRNLTNLTTFKISDCSRLLKLPESIGNLKLLRELEIYDCDEVTILPESIGQLQSLIKINLKDVKSLERLPSSIGKLRALKELVVDDCGKVILPETFADLVLDKPAEECSLEDVAFIGSTKLVRNGLRVTLALKNLQELGVLRCDNEF
jgi:Leucine-rich repeat (LRR) protein